ncbi:MAG: pantoate--beta-alanine ligase [Deltaproteobacteria bacterium]
MEIFRAPREMQSWAEARRAAGSRLGLVPTMGCLHEGHLSLLRVAREHGCDTVAATIFVNPTQFGPGEDYDRYPRQEEEDLAMLREAGADAVLLPGVGGIYPEGFQTFVEVGEVSKGLCGDRRPGHFRGVATVVLKLLHIGKPHVAVFGEKDFQQLAVIRRMVADLDLDVEIVGAPIVREPDGLAMSSRNRYLGPEDRAAARCLSRALFRARDLFRAGERKAEALAAAVRKEIEAEARAALEYAEVRDPDSLFPVTGRAERMTILVAAKVGPARLIDNITLEGGGTA